MKKLNRHALEAYLNCKFKGRLILSDQQGIKSNYEAVLTEQLADIRLSAIEKIRLRHPTEHIPQNVPLTNSALKKGASVVLDATFEDDIFSLTFDGLARVTGPSKLGDFHYVPVLFHNDRNIGKPQRLLLSLWSLILGRLQGRPPANGIVWHGSDPVATKIRLNSAPRDVERLLREVREMATADSQSPLILNDHCSICEFQQRCHDQAVRDDNLSLLRGMAEKEIKAFARRGILTITQLAHTFRPRRKGKRAAQSGNKRYHSLQALAIRDKRIYVFGVPTISTSPVTIYLDLEGQDNLVYLIGMIVVENGNERRYSLWADGPKQESSIFEQFLNVVSQFEDFVVFCYGSYEKTFLQRMRRNKRWEQSVDNVLKRLVNVLSLIYANVYFPTYSNGLKDIARYLGCTWTEADASGIQSLAWRMKWDITHYEVWKQTLLTYNQEDCAALKKVTELICRLANKDGSGQARIAHDGASIPVSMVQEVDALANQCKWGKVNFFHTDFDHINDCAYFDYQRDKVFVRTSQTLRRNKAKQTGSRNRKLRVSKFIRIASLTCPSCGSDKLTTTIENKGDCEKKPRVKRAFDLVFTPGGIRRRILMFRTSIYQCLECGFTYVPEQYMNLDKHFNGLKSWAIFQHVEHRLSLMTIQNMIQQFFGFTVFDCEVHMFKTLMALYYDTTYRNLLSKILAGNLLHVDETEVKLRVGKGYVWVFTNLEEVVFMFRPTREGDFLKELLKDFKGVLVSDFYSVYDFLDSPQQKCLIHLMRDMNQELLNNPYDDELQSVTGPFGTLLRAVVTTVDKHGLKRRFLRCHDRDVTRFFKRLEDQSFRSEAAESLRDRLLRNRSKLFTFIQHDGVPWNNNNAENAIKRFAYYREIP